MITPEKIENNVRKDIILIASVGIILFVISQLI